MGTVSDRLEKIQSILDAAIVKAQETYLLDLSMWNSRIEVAHQALLLAMFDCADGKATIETVKDAFRNYLDLVKVSQGYKMFKTEPDTLYNEGRLCFSIGCLGFVKYIAGKGKCETCGLFQTLLKEEFLLCTSTTYSVKNEMTPVVSLAERRRQKQLESSKKPLENVQSLF